MKFSRHRSFARKPLAAALLLAATGASALSTSPTSGTDLLSGFGGAQGFGELAMLANDDGSSNQLNLPFAINFFGTTYEKFYANNNGNITFRSPLATYTPLPFPIANQPTIAPWWGDVDTRGGVPLGNPPSNAVYVASPNADTTVVTWHNVGYYGNRTDKLNNFQLVLRSRADTGAGNFDFDFRYNKLEWTTGDASNGQGGLGGTPAQAGYDDGQLAHYYSLPGSLTPEVLNLANLSNVSTNTPGLWTFAVRNGATPGGTESNPLMPVVMDHDYNFNFDVVLNQRVFIDPLVAVGYVFALTSGPSFQSVVLPNVGDGEFDLSVWDGSSYVPTATLHAGVTYSFAPGGVRRFRIGGIETSANLDPANTSAFVTGLTFAGSGTINMTQSPITTSVPEPASFAMMALGLALLGAGSCRRRLQP